MWRNDMTAAFDREPEEKTHLSERLFRWFRFSHLREGEVQDTSRRFHDLADVICSTVTPGPERTVCLRKLLEAKDAAVRAVIHPGG